MMVAGKAAAGLRLVRIHAAATAAALALLGAHLAGTATDAGTVVLLALAVASATAAGNALNDVHDRAIDAVNWPGRPIPSGAIGVGTATTIAFVGFVLSLACAAFLSAWCLVLALLNCALLAAYAAWSKRLGGAKCAIVGWLVGSAVLFGAVTPSRIDLVVATLAVCAALATFARELVKDVEDMAGDRAAGARTLPIRIGAGASRRIAAAALGLAVAIASVPWVTGHMGDRYAAIVVAGAAVLAWAAAVPDARRAQRLIMAGSVVEMAAFGVGA